MPHQQKNYLRLFGSTHSRIAIVAVPLVVLASTFAASCSHDWETYDPRLGSSSSSTNSSSSADSSSSGLAGAGGMSGTGGMGGSSGMGGAGGGITCVPDTGKACYSGPPGTENVGMCKNGATLCQADGMSYGPCLGEVTPIVESCNTPTVDDDCNGEVNDHCGLWAIRAGTALDQRTHGVATDSAGNVYITGRMFGNADFGGGVLTSAGGADIFAAKFDNDGKYVWSHVFGGPTDDAGNAIAVDAMGNSFITGYFSGTATFGADTVTAVEGQDAFVIAIDPMGNYVGYVAMGGAGNEYGDDFKVDAAGNGIVTGAFDLEITTPLGTMTAAAALDGFVMKLDNGGNFLWQKSFGGVGDDKGTSIATDAASNVYLTGTFDETIDFGGGVIPDGGSIDVFVAKLDAMGNHILSKGFPSSGNQYSDAVAVDAMGNIFLFGDFETTVNMGGGAVASKGSIDMFLTKLDATGAHVFTKTYGDVSDQVSTAMVVDNNGDIVFASAHEATVDFGGGPLTNAGSAGSSDVVVVKLKGSTGAHMWSRRFGNGSDQDPRCLAIDGMNNIFVGGEFSGSINFGSGSITANSSDDAWLAKLPP